jgi:hypothetical protein
LTSVTIGNGVTRIVMEAFDGCTGLTSVTIHATTPPTLGVRVFRGTHANLQLFVPAGSVDTWPTTGDWAPFGGRIFQIIP